MSQQIALKERSKHFSVLQWIKKKKKTLTYSQITSGDLTDYQFLYMYESFLNVQF